MNSNDIQKWKHIVESAEVDEGYTVMPAIDRERYQDREDQGLEGPFVMRNGQVLYYDKSAGKYYNPDVDMYVSDEEYFAMDRKGLDEEAHDVIRDYMAMGYSRAQAEAEARKQYPEEFDQPQRPQQPQRKPVLQHMVFFDVKPGQEDAAFRAGLRKTKSGKFAVSVYDTSGRNTHAKISNAEKVFGPGKKWSPKPKTESAELAEAGPPQFDDMFYLVLNIYNMIHNPDEWMHSSKRDLVPGEAKAIDNFHKKYGEYGDRWEKAAMQAGKPHDLDAYDRFVKKYVARVTKTTLAEVERLLSLLSSMGEGAELEEGTAEMLARYHKYKDKQMSPVEAQEFKQLVRKLKAAGVSLKEAITITADNASELADLLQMSGLDASKAEDYTVVDAEPAPCEQCGDPECTCPPGECSCGEEPEQQGPSTLSYRYETDKDKIIDTIKDRLQKKLGF